MILSVSLILLQPEFHVAILARGCKPNKKYGSEKNILTFAFCSPIFAPGRGNGKRVVSA